MNRSQLYNSVQDVVQEALGGLIALSNGELVLVEERIVARKRINDKHVALLCLGGSGHEPCHGGMVGHGMLTAAVAGNVFSSPPSAHILTALRTVTTRDGPGAVILCKNYTGDVVNSQTAKEIAERDYGLRVEIVVIADDVATSGLGIGARGLAGTILCQKICGELAEQGANLDTVATAARTVANRLATLGVSFSSCSVPGATEQTRAIPPNKAELGLGIHGEPGIRMLDQVSNSKQVARVMLEQLCSKDKSKQVVLLVNNLGSISNLEMLVFVNDVVRLLGDEHQVECKLVMSGTVMTSLDAAGVSITLLFEPTTQEIDALRAPTSALGWPFPTIGEVRKHDHLVDVSEGLLSTKRARRVISGEVPLVQDHWIAGLRRGCVAIENNVDKLNHLDSLAGDGDTGNSLKRAASALLQELDQLKQPISAIDILEVGQRVSDKTGGSFGGLISFLFQGGLEWTPDEHFSWRGVWAKGIQCLRDHNAASRGERSFMDALIPALEALDKGLEPRQAAAAARSGCNSTANMEARVGRACHVPVEKYAGHVDAGAEAVALFLQAMLAM